MAKRHEFKVAMTCEGCSGAVNRVLGKKEGIIKVDIDLPNKKVFVETELSNDEVLEVIKKTNLKTEYIGST